MIVVFVFVLLENLLDGNRKTENNCWYVVIRGLIYVLLKSLKYGGFTSVKVVDVFSQYYFKIPCFWCFMFLKFQNILITFCNNNLKKL